MKIVFVSDTHCYFENIHKKLPVADVLVHCGDLLNYGSMPEFARVAREFGNIKHKFKHIVITAGNHDMITQKEPVVCKTIMKENGNNIHLLLDEEIILDGVKFYGSPRTPEFFYWYWMYKRGEEAKRIWSWISDDTDVLITHGPPEGVLDTAGWDLQGNDLHVGCVELRDRVREIKPKIHAFGHIHNAYGTVKGKNTLFINASTCDDRYIPNRKPILVDFNEETREVALIDYE